MQSCCTSLISASYRVYVCGRYRKSWIVYVCLSDLDFSRHRPLLCGAVPAIPRVRMTDGRPAKKVSIQYAQQSAITDVADSYTTCRLCRLEPILIHFLLYLLNGESACLESERSWVKSWPTRFIGDFYSPGSIIDKPFYDYFIYACMYILNKVKVYHNKTDAFISIK